MSKVIRWHCVGLTPNAANGNFVALEDYESLRDALREALDGWTNTTDAQFTERTERRIAALRARFLDDK